MSLVATKTINKIDDETPITDGNAAITSEVFWPAIVLSGLRQSMRLNGGVTTSRLKHMATEATLYANQLLAEWRAEQEKNGFASLNAVPSPIINDTTAHVFRYHHAVYSFTKALLIENYRDIDTTRDGEKHAEALSTQIDDLRRDGQNAIRDILGKHRMIAELV
ncbi:head completion/stabilization protein [Xenorhabdus bovienii]|uniref:head completion/stabilization protein n=1 Tax=Xenorhabdus bovienii TaxID=40576 RepID=UPI0023B2A26B|nr:head completion/stabilization protein [Xenorhabdus bovienii]MDE9494707.1 head completion/stabilization protein [Xenorhabdus bovienii]MDE9503086.1 head completion/stabilization protein [Xenorhabdus bovienii]MDE9526879.1 head completion/stabilization protein [Xenorhabdus bovienii]